MKFSAFLLIVLGILTSSCNPSHEKAPEVIIEKNEVVKLNININEEVSGLIKNQIDQFNIDSLLIIDSDTLTTGRWISKVYTAFNFQPIWTDKSALSSAGDSLMELLSEIEKYGLHSERYHFNDLKQKISGFENMPDSNINITRIYEINILLTDVFFKLGIHLNRGLQNENTFHDTLKVKTTDSSMVTLLVSAIKTDRVISYLQSLEPKFEQYSKLKFLLNLLLNRKVELKRKDSDSLNMLDSSMVFYFNGHLPNDTINSFFNSTDTIENKIQQLNANLERWRWEAMKDEDKSIFVNVASNTFRYNICDSTVLKSKVITGKPDAQTPFNLNSRVSHFFIYPYWNVPFSIATKEMLPKLKKDTSYLSKENMEVLNMRNEVIDYKTINWKKYSINYFPFRLRQRDGSENTLGVLKFMFSNPYGIYLHDTNSRGLFKKQNRWLSHGCIRLEKARELAELICETSAENFNRDSLDHYITIKTRQQVNIKPSIPIHIRYFTIEADSNNFIFYKDAYQIDSMMNEAIITKQKIAQ